MGVGHRTLVLTLESQVGERFTELPTHLLQPGLQETKKKIQLLYLTRTAAHLVLVHFAQAVTLRRGVQQACCEDIITGRMGTFHNTVMTGEQGPESLDQTESDSWAVSRPGALSHSDSILNLTEEAEEGSPLFFRNKQMLTTMLILELLNDIPKGRSLHISEARSLQKRSLLFPGPSSLPRARQPTWNLSSLG